MGAHGSPQIQCDGLWWHNIERYWKSTASLDYSRGKFMVAKCCDIVSCILLVCYGLCYTHVTPIDPTVKRSRCQGDPWTAGRKNEEEWRAAQGVASSAGRITHCGEVQEFLSHYPLSQWKMDENGIYDVDDIEWFWQFPILWTKVAYQLLFIGIAPSMSLCFSGGTLQHYLAALGQWVAYLRSRIHDDLRRMS